MKKHFASIVVVMALCLLACSTGEQGEPAADSGTSGVVWAQLSLDDAKVQAANENKLIMVDVFSPT